MSRKPRLNARISFSTYLLTYAVRLVFKPMNFSVHIDEATLDRLTAAVARSGLTRNRIIVTAVQEWLDGNEERDWPRVLKDHFQNPAPDLAAADEGDLAASRPVMPAAGARW